MSEHTCNLTYNNVQLEVTGHYYKGRPMEIENGAYLPPEDSEFEIDEIIVGGVNIMTLIDEKTLGNIAHYCISQIER